LKNSSRVKDYSRLDDHTRHTTDTPGFKLGKQFSFGVKFTFGGLALFELYYLRSGWFRQCDIIPHSKDVDIGIWIKDYNPLLISEFEKSGLILKHRFGRVSFTVVVKFFVWYLSFALATATILSSLQKDRR